MAWWSSWLLRDPDSTAPATGLSCLWALQICWSARDIFWPSTFMTRCRLTTTCGTAFSRSWAQPPLVICRFWCSIATFSSRSLWDTLSWWTRDGPCCWYRLGAFVRFLLPLQRSSLVARKLFWSLDNLRQCPCLSLLLLSSASLSKKNASHFHIQMGKLCLVDRRSQPPLPSGSHEKECLFLAIRKWIIVRGNIHGKGSLPSKAGVLL